MQSEFSSFHPSESEKYTWSVLSDCTAVALVDHHRFLSTIPFKLIRIFLVKLLSAYTVILPETQRENLRTVCTKQH